MTEFRRETPAAEASQSARAPTCAPGVENRESQPIHPDGLLFGPAVKKAKSQLQFCSCSGHFCGSELLSTRRGKKVPLMRRSDDILL